MCNSFYTKGVLYYMRKKSHFSIASYLMQSEGMEVLATHKKAFYIGNILPDCVPSFLTQRHCIEDTFHILKKELHLLIEEYNFNKGVTAYFCRHLGVILHYISDYFTFPHNSFYSGNFKDHCFYEKEMKFYLRAYVKTKEAQLERRKEFSFHTADELCTYIRERHKSYAQMNQTVALDCEYIVDLCHHVVDYILGFFDTTKVPTLTSAGSYSI